MIMSHLKCSPFQKVSGSPPATTNASPLGGLAQERHEMNDLKTLKEFMQVLVDDPEMTDGWNAFIAVQVKISELEAAQQERAPDVAKREQK